MITQDLIKELFEYKDGNLIWRINRGSNKIKGNVAGTPDKDGYKIVTLNSKKYKAHRLIWIYHNGDIQQDLQIDHINGIRDDNCISNLRLVTHQENNFNTNAKGYYWNKKDNKYTAQIVINGESKYLGQFINKNDALNAYLLAKEEHHKIGVRH